MKRVNAGAGIIIAIIVGTLIYVMSALSSGCSKKGGTLVRDAITGIYKCAKVLE